MGADPRERITEMLQALDRGGPQPAEELLPLVYDELRALARARLAREGPGITLQATGLVHEAWLRLVGDADPGWNGRGHFFGAAARAMRRILVEDARRRARLKRGGAVERVELRESAIAAPSPDEDVLLLEAATRRLEAEDARKGEIVNLRYFAGLSNEETARALGLSEGTIEREWRFIRAWLRTEIAGRAGRETA